MLRSHRLDQSLFAEVNPTGMLSSRRGSREVEIPVLEKRIVCAVQERAADVFSENTSVLVLFNEMLTESWS